MAIGDFHWRIPGSSDPTHWKSVITARGDIALDVFLEVQIDDSPEAWVQVPDGHRTVILQAQAVVAIAQGPGTPVQKRQAVLALITDAVLAFGLAQSYQGAAAFVSLLPNGKWPVTDVTEPIVP